MCVTCAEHYHENLTRSGVVASATGTILGCTAPIEMVRSSVQDSENRGEAAMLRWIVRALLLRTLLRRFWFFGILYAIARRFLPWEQATAGRTDRRRGYS